jgi:ABC-type glutathione transport system ATPase component
MNNILEIKNLTVRIGGRLVLDDVSFELLRGEVLALVGESGSGKTMTALSILNLLPGAAALEKGSIFFDNKDLLTVRTEEIREIRGRRISMVFQEPFTAFNPVMRIGEQIKETVHAHKKLGKKETDMLIGDLLRTVMLPEDVISHYPHELSGGMRQRAMLAMALSCEPSVLILDEPTTALDVTIQKHILELVKKIQKERELAVLFITHDFSIVNMIADRVLVMKGGRLVEAGEKKEVLTSPKHAYTKGLIACIPRIGDTRDRLPVIED